MADDLEDPDLWAELLSSVYQKKKQTKPTRTLLIFGDRECGKTTLKDMMKGITRAEEEVTAGIALEYDYLDVRDPDNPNGDVISRLDVWTVNGAQKNTELLKAVLGRDQLVTRNADGDLEPACLVLVAVDLSKPWTIKSSLEGWLQLCQPLVSQLVRSKEDFAAMQMNIRHYHQKFQQTDGFQQPLDPNFRSLALNDAELGVNVGLPVVVVGTKSDRLAKDSDKTPQQIQQLLRGIAYTYGAAVVHTSSTLEATAEALYQYIGHRLYAFDFKPACIQPVVSQSIFIPSAWDSLAKIQAVYNSNKPIQFQPPQERTKQKAQAEMSPLEHQAFLKSLAESQKEKKTFTQQQLQSEDRKKKKEVKEQFEQTKGTNESVAKVATDFYSMLSSKKEQRTPVASPSADKEGDSGTSEKPAASTATGSSGGTSSSAAAKTADFLAMLGAKKEGKVGDLARPPPSLISQLKDRNSRMAKLGDDE